MYLTVLDHCVSNVHHPSTRRPPCDELPSNSSTARSPPSKHPDVFSQVQADDQGRRSHRIRAVVPRQRAGCPRAYTGRRLARKLAAHPRRRSRRSCAPSPTSSANCRGSPPTQIAVAVKSFSLVKLVGAAVCRQYEKILPHGSKASGSKSRPCRAGSRFPWVDCGSFGALLCHVSAPYKTVVRWGVALLFAGC
eukprot:COSAG02_NODE_397_length_23124_cov_439.255635_4_plen_193_part_00